MKKKEWQPSIYVGQNLYIRPSYIVSIPEYAYESNYSSVAFEKNKENLKDNSHNGILSKKAITGLRNAINWLCLAAEKKRVFQKSKNRNFYFKIGFLTLTLPDTKNPVEKDFFTKKLLNNFLVYLRKYHNLKNYVWKLEYQKNGKIHAHITIDCFVHHRIVRDSWNRILRSNGLLELFEQEFNHSNPNSTDIHSVAKIKDIAAYLAKYMSKDMAANKKIKGRIWGCSYELSRANKTKLHVPSPECSDTMRTLMTNEIDYTEITTPAKDDKPPRLIGEIFYLKARDWFKVIKGEIKNTFIETINNLRAKNQFFTEKEFYSV